MDKTLPFWKPDHIYIERAQAWTRTPLIVTCQKILTWDRPGGREFFSGLWDGCSIAPLKHCLFYNAKAMPQRSLNWLFSANVFPILLSKEKGNRKFCKKYKFWAIRNEFLHSCVVTTRWLVFKTPFTDFQRNIPSATSICYSGNGPAYFWDFFHNNFEYKTQKNYKT